MNAVARAIAFYLPQFHPIPENDAWWGKGFTEWRNVASAKPHFPGHHQPRIPANLGFYDLRVPETRERQADLARDAGIEAFCYWHYWFHGKRLLDRPFREVLRSGRPSLPFCLCWANETWSRTWLGDEFDILQQQTYSREDDVRHARMLVEAMRDERYLRVHGRPLLLIYRPNNLPEPAFTLATIADTAERAGLARPFFLGINSFEDNDYRTVGFDGTVDFAPAFSLLPADERQPRVYDLGTFRERMAQRRRARPYPTYPTVLVDWDNTPRRGERAIVLTGGSAQQYEDALRAAVGEVADRAPDERLVFVNAWNEWAEGNHLEPDERHGTAYLEATRRVLRHG